MQKGSAVESGDARTVLKAPQHPYSRQLRDAVLLPDVANTAAAVPVSMTHLTSPRTSERGK
jgi:peptide/nickel transport system ATP-binding protein